MKGCRAQKSWHAGRELLTEHRTLQSMLRWSLLCVFSWVGAITDVCLCPQVAYLLVYGELPSSKELARWDEALMRHSAVPDAVERAVAALPHDAHFMGIVLVALNALSTVHPEQNPALAGQNIYKSKEMQDKQIVRLIGERPTAGLQMLLQRPCQKAAPLPQSSRWPCCAAPCASQFHGHLLTVCAGNKPPGVQARCRQSQLWRTTEPADATSASPTSACHTPKTSCTCLMLPTSPATSPTPGANLLSSACTPCH